MKNLSLQPEKNIYKYCFYLILTAFVAYAIFSIHASTRQMYWDFPNYYVSANLLSQGESVSQFYDNSWFEAKGSEMGMEHPVRFNPFPPITSLLMLPLSSFEPLVAKRIWVLINVALLVLAIKLFSKLFHFDYTLSAFILFLSGASLGLNFRLGQYYLVILVLLLLVYQAYQKGQLRRSALLLSAIAIIKYFPLVFIVGFLKRKYLLFFGIGMLGLILIQWLMFGTETIQTYITILQNHLVGKIDGQGQHPIAFQSFNSLFANIFIEHPITANPPIIDWPMGKKVGLLSVFLVVTGSALYTIKRIHQRTNASDLIMTIVGMAALTLLPASAPYHYLLLLFPLMLLMKWQLGRGYALQSLILVSLYAMVSNVQQIPIPSTGIQSIDLIMSYPRLWAVTILYFYSLRIILKSSETYNNLEDQKFSYQHLLGKTS